MPSNLDGRDKSGLNEMTSLEMIDDSTSTPHSTDNHLKLI